MVGNAGEADGAEEYGVVAADSIEPVFRHHAAGLSKGLATPGKLVPVEFEAEARTGRFEHADTLGHHFLADAIARNDGDPVFLHS